MTDPNRPTLRQRLADAGIGTVGQIIAAVVSAVVIAFLLGSRVGGSNNPDPPEPKPNPTPSPSLQAKDEAVPDAKGQVKERVWSEGARTFADPYSLTNEGQPRIPHNRSVLVSCKFYWPYPESVEHDGYWYRVESQPWKGLFTPANSFWNGDVPGKPYTHHTDWRVPECEADELPQR